MIACPECGAKWPDTYGAGGGRRNRFLHMYENHGDGRGIPFKQLEGL